MQMKYLKEQDTGKRFLPAVHTSGIVGYNDSAKENPVSITSININDQGVTGKLTVLKYNKIATFHVSLNIGDEAMEEFKQGREVVVSLGNTLPSYGSAYARAVTFDMISYDKDGNILIIPTMGMLFKYNTGESGLTILPNVIRNDYSVDESGSLTVTPNYITVSNIIGYATTIAILGGE